MTNRRIPPDEGKYHDGLDDAFERLSASRGTALQGAEFRGQRKRPASERREMKSAEELADEVSRRPQSDGPKRRFSLSSPPAMAGIVFGVLSLIASASMLPMLIRFADAAGMPTAIVVGVPALFAVVFALVFFRGSAVGTWPVALGRGIVVALATWLAISVVAASVWCRFDVALSCFGGILLTAGVVSGGQMLLAALIGGAVMAWLLRRNSFI